MRTWVIGNSPECDVVVDSPLVSSRHCRLTETADGMLLEDLGSTNGTHVDGTRIVSATRVKFGDTITLGRTVPMPWPPGVVRYLSIGRVAGNDIVVDDPRVSSRHARLIVVSGSETMIEDLGSSNGTFLNSPDLRLTVAVALAKTDTVYFGSFAMPAARLLAATESLALPPLAAAAAPDFPTRPPIHFSPTMAHQWEMVVAATTLALAVVISLIFGRNTVASIELDTPMPVRERIASVTFALAILPIALGCAMTAIEAAPDRSSHRRRSLDPTALVIRLLALSAVCTIVSGLALGIVYWGTGLRGSWLAMWGIMALASSIGLSLGLIVTLICRAWPTIALLLFFCIALMIALGGRIWPIPALGGPIRLASAAMPARWAFEGLLLQESDAMPSKSFDLAEPYFPSATDRMGTLADTMALAFMTVGLAAAGLIISGLSRPGP